MANFCRECGKENAEDAQFCSSCGSSLGAASESFENESVNSRPAEPVKRENANNGGSVFAILGWIFTAISTLFVPILFAAGGVIFGYLHRKVNQTHGTIIMIAAIACGLFGMILGAATAMY